MPLEDCRQELYVWALERLERCERYVNGGKLWSLGQRLREVGARWALKERAERTGYEVSDIFFYTTEQIAAMVPYALGLESIADIQLGYSLESSGSGGLASEGGNVLAMSADVSGAVKKLSADDIAYLVFSCVCGLDWDYIGEIDGILPKSAWNRYDRIITRIQKLLGGPKPWNGTGLGSRKVISNAQAATLTQENQ